MLTLTCMKWIPEDPTTIFLTTRFYLKNSTKIRFYVFLNFHARYFSYFFSWSGPNSEEILNFTPIYFGCPGTYNWNRISSFLWNSLLEYSYMFSSMKMAEYIESELSGIFLEIWSPGTQPLLGCLCNVMSLSEEHTKFVNKTVRLKCFLC